MVGWCWMPSCWHKTSQMAEVNCVPLSEVSCAGTPYLEIQPAMRASAKLVAAMTDMGKASSQRDDLSTTVNRYLLPQVAAGRGPTMSTWMWVNRLAGMAIEAAPHHPGGYEPLGGPRAGVCQLVEGGEHGGPVHQRPHSPSGDVTEELYSAEHPLLYL